MCASACSRSRAAMWASRAWIWATIAVSAATNAAVTAAAATLAGVVLAQWRAEAQVRALGDPEPDAGALAAEQSRTDGPSRCDHSQCRVMKLGPTKSVRSSQVRCSRVGSDGVTFVLPAPQRNDNASDLHKRTSRQGQQI